MRSRWWTMPVASCKDVQEFLGQVSARSVTTPLPDPDLARLGELGLLRVLSADDLRALTSEVAALPARQEALAQEGSERAVVATELSREYGRTHSVLFHLHGRDKEQEELDQEAQTRARLAAVDTDYAQKQAAFNDLLAKRALLDNLSGLGDRFVGLTPSGAAALRDLTVRLYRFGDVPFDAYFAQAQQIDRELVSLASVGAGYFGGLAQGIGGADQAYLWAISVGLARAQPDPAQGVPRFLEAYGATAPLSHNPENRLMSSEILVAIPRPLPEEVPLLGGLVRDVRKLGVDDASALGVASIVLFGRRADGSFATATLQQFLQRTRCYEAAALLGIVNAPIDPLAQKFQTWRSMFGSWGYGYSEDTELSAAYLAVSDLAPEEVSSKLAILSRGLATYLQYPLVAAAILASIPTLEANETLNVVEKAYGVIGSRARGLSQAELVSVAVRMVHGIRNELVGNLDATATQPPAAAARGGPGFFPRPVFLPILVVHGAYYSTFGGIGGVHPGHVHGMPGGFGGLG